MTVGTWTRVFLAGLSATLLLLSEGSIAQSTAAAPSYKIVEQWSIPNGGFGRAIVVKANPTEVELRALGEKLRQDTRNDRNAFVFVYDDERAARNTRAAFSEKLPKAELRQHDRHQVAKYFRNANIAPSDN